MICLRTFLLAASIFSIASAHAQDRVSLSPNSVLLLPGDSIEVTVSLNEPIIVPTPPGYVTLDMQSGDERVSLSPTTLTWSDSEWFQKKTFLITMTGNEAPGNEFNFSALGVSVNSNSEFFDGYLPTFSVIVGRGPLLIDSFELISSSATSSTLER